MQAPIGCWVNVETSAGAVVGDGPIRHVIAWSSTAQLSKAGSFSLTVAAADPRAALLQSKRVVRCWAIIAGEPTEIGGGIIDTIQWTANGDGMVATGSDLLAELRYRSVRDLEIYDETLAQPTKVWLYLEPAGVPTYTDLTNTYDGNLATESPFDLTSSNGFLFIGYSDPFTVLYTFQGIGGNAIASSLRYRYSAPPFDWNLENADLPMLAEDTNSVAGVPFPVLASVNDPPIDGTRTLLIRPPADWEMYAVNSFDAYWIRLDPGSNIDSIPVREFAIGLRHTSTTDVSRIMDGYAPPLWTTGDEWKADADGVTIFEDTAAGSYAAFSGELVLAALVKVARRSGESFRLGAGRRLHWLHSTGDAASFADSGIRAVRNTGSPRQSDNPLICLIVSLEEMRDTNDLITRIYPYGAGSGKARVSLVNSTKTAAFATLGYTMDIAENYIESNAGVAAYGQIEREMSFKDIRATDDLTFDSAGACDQLALATLEFLKRHSSEQKFYRLEVVGAQKLLQVGTRIHVIYREVHDGRITMDIDDDLIILSATSTFAAGEAYTTMLEVGTTDALPATDAEVIADVIEAGAVYQSHSQYLDALVVI